jgi:hypothetical protein
LKGVVALHPLNNKLVPVDKLKIFVLNVVTVVGHVGEKLVINIVVVKNLF